MMGQIQSGLEKELLGHSEEFNRQKKFGKMIDTLGERLTRLTELGENVKTEDVIKASTGLVASGFGAKEIATLLADMPPEGPQLAGWLAQRAQETQQAAQAFDQQFNDMRHQLGTAAMHVIAAHSGGQPQSPTSNQLAPAQPTPQANPLTEGASPNA
jgi:hypothetical protein